MKYPAELPNEGLQQTKPVLTPIEAVFAAERRCYPDVR